MELSLKVMTGKNAGQEVRVPVAKFIIGRSEDCHLRPHSDLVSRHHCAILMNEGTVAIRDFNSKNGTFVNGEKVVGQRTLKSGDQLSIGQLTFEVHASHGATMNRRPKVKDIADAAARTVAGENQDEDTDVSDWLSEDTSITGSLDTKANDLTHTSQFTPEQIVDGQKSKSSSGDGNKTSDSKAPVAGKKAAGKLPPMPSAPASKDSREAASEMLKKILRNR